MTLAFSRSKADNDDRSCETEAGRRKALAGASIMHFVNDMHPTFLPTFLPMLVRDLGLSLGQAGALNTLFGLLNLIVQPFAGRAADKIGRPAFANFAPLLTAAGACLLPLAPNYGVAIILVSLIALGTSCFHPQGHGLAGAAGGEAKLGAYIALFGAAGSLGTAVSPIYGVYLFDRFGPYWMPVIVMAVASVGAAAAYVLMPRAAAPRDEHHAHAKQGFFDEMKRVFWIALPMIMISIVRDSTSQGIRVFLPLLVTGRGGSLGMGGTVLFAFTVAQTAANLAGGKLADMFGARRVIIVMLVLAPVFLLPAIHMDGAAAIALFLLGGLCIAATNPVTLAIAQSAAPESRSTVSSLVMGVSWGIANIIASPIGMLADAIGLETTLSIVALMPLSAVAVMLLRRRAQSKSSN